VPIYTFVMVSLRIFRLVMAHLLTQTWCDKWTIGDPLYVMTANAKSWAKLTNERLDDEQMMMEPWHCKNNWIRQAGRDLNGKQSTWVKDAKSRRCYTRFLIQ
jgi:hypothetical protein